VKCSKGGRNGTEDFKGEKMVGEMENEKMEF
jgi:hypothetical protein